MLSNMGMQKGVISVDEITPFYLYYDLKNKLFLVTKVQ